MTIGIPPGNGFQAVDGVWLNALAGSQNITFQNGIVAAGTTQATSVQLLPGVALFETDTVAANTGVALPPAVAGTEVSIFNNGANPLKVYPSIANNGLTGAQDTINGTNSLTVTNATSAYLFCAKNGVWAAK